jgi:hypothetical protein
VGEAVKLGAEVVKPLGPQTLPVSTPSTLMACDNELSSAPEPEDDEQLIDYVQFFSRAHESWRQLRRYDRFQ